MAHKQFIDFLNKLTTPKNEALMEAVKKGYKICCEATSKDTPHELFKAYNILFGTRESTVRPTVSDIEKVQLSIYEQYRWIDQGIPMFKELIPENIVNETDIKTSGLGSVEKTIADTDAYIPLVNKPFDFAGYRISTMDGTYLYTLMVIKYKPSPAILSLPSDDGEKASDWREKVSRSGRHAIRLDRYNDSYEGRLRNMPPADDAKLNQFASIARTHGIDVKDFHIIDIDSSEGRTVGSAIGYKFYHSIKPDLPTYHFDGMPPHEPEPDTLTLDTLASMAIKLGLSVRKTKTRPLGFGSDSIEYAIYDPKTFVPNSHSRKNEEYL